MTDIARTFGVSHSTISQLRAEVEGQRESNHWLDQQVTTLREQRDQALGFVVVSG